jgi:HTH-type transcriptional regulator/antitoxin HigA
MNAGTNPRATPGELIQQRLAARGWTQRTLSAVLNVGESSITRLLRGTQPIDAGLAVALEEILGIPADELLLLQAAGDLARARTDHRPDPRRVVRARLYGDLPLRDMIKRGWLDVDDIRDGEQVDAALLDLFGVQKIEDLEHLAHSGPALSRSVWLARVRQVGRQMGAPPCSLLNVEVALPDLRRLLRNAESVADVPHFLLVRGIRLVLVEALPGAPIDMACLWLDRLSPVVGLSLRDDRIDTFWLLLRHALEQVLHQNECVLWEGCDCCEGHSAEIAAEFCVPASALDAFIARRAPFITKDAMIAFADELEVHPGILAGLLQARTGRYEHFSSYQVKVRPVIARHATCDGWGTRPESHGRAAPKAELLPEGVVTPA